ncbi:hypothetical protein FKG94_27465 [Exilibacterium tricleocarpae]|uniref:Uncharacterized protein n=1 Tax=Exilibacterium tricleocarpae TaxID=2591008 RepID=A0A545SMG3_9GAMM|nr:hypothetical protein [Exilibacterium tricleocarpae]TQV66165.1 hypothetical protein FKG94_27465 [Exilibacterium tricleocarpae]
MNTAVKRCFLRLGVACLTILSLSAYAESTQVAQVGAYGADGKIELLSDRFLKEFPNGRPIAEISVVNVGGYLHLSRKGFAGEQGCRVERIQLVDAQRTPLVAGSDPAEGGGAFIISAYPTELIGCKDDGCHALRNVPPWPQSAICDNTEASDGKCACHINRGFGIEIIRDGLFCLDLREIMISNLLYWMKAPWVSDETIYE